MASAAEQIGGIAAFLLLLVGVITVTNAISEAAVTFALALQRRLLRRREVRKLREYDAEFLPAKDYEQLWGESS